MKHLIVIFVGLFTFASAHADICAAINKLNVAAISQNLVGLKVSADDAAFKGVIKGIAAKAGTDNSDDGITYTDINLTLEDGSVVEDADLGHIFLVCPQGHLENLAGALKLSGILCAEGQYEANIPPSVLNLKCQTPANK